MFTFIKYYIILFNFHNNALKELLFILIFTRGLEKNSDLMRKLYSNIYTNI